MPSHIFKKCLLIILNFIPPFNVFWEYHSNQYYINVVITANEETEISEILKPDKLGTADRALSGQFV